jgi:hypothetical protein
MMVFWEEVWAQWVMNDRYIMVLSPGEMARDQINVVFCLSGFFSFSKF